MKRKSIYYKFKVYVLILFMSLLIFCDIILFIYNEFSLGFIFLLILILMVIAFVITDSRIISYDHCIVVSKKFRRNTILYEDIDKIAFVINETNAIQKWININIILKDVNVIKVNFFLFIVEKSSYELEKICRRKMIKFDKVYKKIGEK